MNFDTCVDHSSSIFEEDLKKRVRSLHPLFHNVGSKLGNVWFHFGPGGYLEAPLATLCVAPLPRELWNHFGIPLGTLLGPSREQLSAMDPLWTPSASILKPLLLHLVVSQFRHQIWILRISHSLVRDNPHSCMNRSNA